MSKITAYVMLVSLIVGVSLEIIFPQILLFEFKNRLINISLNEIKGSAYAVGFGFPILIMALGGFIAEILIRRSKNYRKK